jgi:protein-disulfide isomerase
MTSAISGRVLFTCLLVVSMGACSRSDEPSTAAAPAQPAAEAAAAAPAPASSNESAPLTAEQVARLVRPHSPVWGRAQAPVTVVEVLDPACEACKAFAPVVEQLLFTYPEDVRVVVRYADFHPVSLQAIRLLVAARVQGKDHQLLAALFDRQQEWASHASPNPAQAWKIAKDVGINVPKAQKDALAASVDDILRQEADDLTELKVEQTPTFFVNGKPLPTFGAQQLMDLVASEVRESKSKR